MPGVTFNIESYMTPRPYCVNADATLAAVRVLMSERNIRHVPVLEAGKVIGILSDRDLKLIQSCVNQDPETLKAGDFGVKEVYEVDVTTPLDVAARTMGKERYGCAIVTKDSQIVGIFTTVDACNALASILKVISSSTP